MAYTPPAPPATENNHWAYPKRWPSRLLLGLRVIMCVFIVVSTGYLLFRYISFRGIGMIVLTAFTGLKNVPWPLFLQAGLLLLIIIDLIIALIIGCCMRSSTKSKTTNVTSIVLNSINVVGFIAVGVVTAIRIFPGTVLKACDPNQPGLPGTPWENPDDSMGGGGFPIGGQIGAITDVIMGEKLVCPIYKTDMWLCWLVGLSFLVEIWLVSVRWRVEARNEEAQSVVMHPKTDVEAGIRGGGYPLMTEQRSAEPGWAQEHNQYQHQGAQQQYYGNTAYDPYGQR